MNDKELEEQLQGLSRHYQQASYPQKQEEFEAAILTARQHKQASHTKVFWAMAACLLVATVSTLAIKTQKSDSDFATSKHEVYFCCNNHCSAEKTIAMMDKLIH